MIFAAMRRGMAVAAIASALVGMPAWGAAIFVYVSNADDGDISSFRMNPVTGTLWPGIRVKAAKLVMPMAVSPDKRFLYAATRSKPYSVMTYAIEPHSGGLTLVSTSPLAESFPYISLDRTGGYLFGASYGANLVSVNAIDNDGRVLAEPLQVINVGRNAHSIHVDQSNRFAFVATLGSDEIFQFTFDEKTGRLASNTPPWCSRRPSPARGIS
jgi:3-carboxymuconate cyclase